MTLTRKEKELRWYMSKSHFNSEKSYEQHLKDLAMRKRRRRPAPRNSFAMGGLRFKIPKF